MIDKNGGGGWGRQGAQVNDELMMARMRKDSPRVHAETPLLLTKRVSRIAPDAGGEHKSCHPAAAGTDIMKQKGIKTFY